MMIAQRNESHEDKGQDKSESEGTEIDNLFKQCACECSDEATCKCDSSSSQNVNVTIKSPIGSIGIFDDPIGWRISDEQHSMVNHCCIVGWAGVDTTTVIVPAICRDRDGNRRSLK